LPFISATVLLSTLRAAWSAGTQTESEGWQTQQAQGGLVAAAGGHGPAEVEGEGAKRWATLKM